MIISSRPGTPWWHDSSLWLSCHLTSVTAAAGVSLGGWLPPCGPVRREAVDRCRWWSARPEVAARWTRRVSGTVVLWTCLILSSICRRGTISIRLKFLHKETVSYGESASRNHWGSFLSCLRPVDGLSLTGWTTIQSLVSSIELGRGSDWSIWFLSSNSWV